MIAAGKNASGSDFCLQISLISSRIGGGLMA
jgi:hypothetical protein